MIVLIQRSGGVCDLVNATEVSVGDEFFYGVDKDNRPQKRVVMEVIEQRKERGEYTDESKRRMWARVKQEVI